MARGLLILTYHQVLDAPDPLRPGEISIGYFAAQMRTLARFFNVLPLAEGVERLQAGTLPSRACCITFDDGYEDNHRLAWPVLKSLGLPATIFVATGYLDGGRMWNDSVIEAVRRMPGDVVDLEDLGLGRYEVRTDGQRYAAIRELLPKLKYRDPGDRETLATALAERAATPLPGKLMMSRDQVRELARDGVDIGGHTVTHPILKELDHGVAADEIREGKRQLEDITGMPVRHFAYPNGQPGRDFDLQHMQMARDAGFSCAVTTESGAARPGGDRFGLPRFGPWAESPVRYGLRLWRTHHSH